MRTLIITDDIDKWREIFFESYKLNSIQYYKEYWSKHEKYIEADTNTYDIKTEVSEDLRGQRYNFVILDKQVPKEMLDKIIFPKTIGEVLYTHRLKEDI